MWNVEHNPRTHWQPKCHNLDWIAGLQSETGALLAGALQVRHFKVEPSVKLPFYVPLLEGRETRLTDGFPVTRLTLLQ